MDIAWKFRRLRHIVRRLQGSIAIRGLRGTLRRAVQAPAAKQDIDEPMPVPVRPPAGLGPHRRMLVIETMTPDPQRDSGSMRLCKIFDLLNADGWLVDFVADDNDANARDVARLAALGVSVHRGSPAPWLRSNGSKLDAIMLCRLPVAEQYIDLARRVAPAAYVVFDTVDLHYVREQRAAVLTANTALARKAARSRKHELSMVRGADLTFVVSDEERDILRRETPGAHIELLSNIHDVAAPSQGFESRRGLLFVGGFGHPPNEDAVRWFVEQVLPLIREHDPSIVLHVVGDIDNVARTSLVRDGVAIHGRVPDLVPLLGQVRISIAPLRFGAGVKGKVNQAMSFGVPVVLTTLAAEGMHLQDGVDALIVDEPAAMAEAIIRLYHDADLWLRISDASLENIGRYFSADAARSAIRRGLDGLKPR